MVLCTRLGETKGWRAVFEVGAFGKRESTSLALGSRPVSTQQHPNNDPQWPYWRALQGAVSFREKEIKRKRAEARSATNSSMRANRKSASP